MRMRLIAALMLCTLAAPAFAHRLDEYLEATMLSVERDHVEGSMRLVPGVAVSERVIASIDANRDGVISKEEGDAYAQRVLGDVMLSVDGERVETRLTGAEYPEIWRLKEGMGEIEVEFRTELPRGGAQRRLVFENRNESGMAAYLVNVLVPQDPRIAITGQQRNVNQSHYEVDFEDHAVASTPVARNGWRELNWLAPTSMFRLGMRHIAEGTDHLLFLLALLLPAPLLASGGRWAGSAGVRASLLRILKVVTAFTVGHSLTLALAAMGVVKVPSRPIEVLIAVSILVSATHALRPLFPGREAWIAGFFGLIHGLAFASTLSLLGLGRWERVGSILGFNLGIEAMQLMVVAATLPSLLLLSRSRGYGVLRVGGALFAGAASLGWIVERTLNVSTPVDSVVNGAAQHAVWMAAGLLAASVVLWRKERTASGWIYIVSLRIRWPWL
jgi:HupE / UreJ protein